MRSIAIIGLGYVGLPLAIEFGKKYQTLGFDINQSRVKELLSGHDATLEVSDEELQDVPFMSYSFSLDDLKACNVYIVTVPTPIDEHKRPDLTPLLFMNQQYIQVLPKKFVSLKLSTFLVWSLIETFLLVILLNVLIQVIKSIE